MLFIMLRFLASETTPLLLFSFMLYNNTKTKSAKGKVKRKVV